MKLMIQPGDGVDRLIKGIKKARKSIEIVIFRFDRSDIERALIDAVERGVLVHTLIAFTNRGGEEHLRRLETHFLANGITVARTAGDLVRYHGKMMIIDRKELYLLAFNLTHLDIDHSRSFGLITRNPKLVQEAAKLFEADTKRQDYVAGSTRFVVSPVNARKVLASFLKGAKKELLIVDPKLSDRAMLRLIEERRKAGVEVRVIGCVARNRLPGRNLSRIRLHARMIICDRKQAFLGSQSLRQLELDARREIGMIFRDARIVTSLARVFEEDWASSEPADSEVMERVDQHLGKAARKMAKIVSKNLPIEPVVKRVIKSIGKNGKRRLDKAKVGEIVETAVREAVKDTVKQAAKGAVKSAVDGALQMRAS